MAEGKYARIAQLAQQYQATDQESEAEEKPGRTRGKSSDSTYARRNVLLKKQTIKTAERLWEDLEPEYDFSDLLEKLLMEWIKKQSA
ncbi:MAG: hypothetical protein AB7N91_14575 [Candidatus Tectimicrobiota bacterium]